MIVNPRGNDPMISNCLDEKGMLIDDDAIEQTDGLKFIFSMNVLSFWIIEWYIYPFQEKSVTRTSGELTVT